MNTPAACQEARDAVACPPANALATARILAHRSHCAECRAYAAELAAIGAAVRAAAGPGLDDIARARVAARLARAIDEVATFNARRRDSRGRAAAPALVAGALAAVAAAVVMLVVHREHAGRAIRPAPAVVARGAAVAAPTLLHPYTVAGMESALALGQATDHLEVPAGGLMRATADRYTRLTLVGPASLRIEQGAAGTTLALESGLLLGEYEHHEGGLLRVRSPGATTIVVGTLFAVQATSGSTSRVAVQRGAVQVRDQTTTVHLLAGWSWASGEGARPELPAALAAELAAQAAALPPPTTKAGALQLGKEVAAP